MDERFYRDYEQGLLHLKNEANMTRLLDPLNNALDTHCINAIKLHFQQYALEINSEAGPNKSGLKPPKPDKWGKFVELFYTLKLEADQGVFHPLNHPESVLDQILEMSDQTFID